ncbi:GGDEF domain-containing protein [Herbaspirillum sp. RTI4]|uniref:GGDEF domain-containing protein n=1 Tax=Herbaspirillum sp. RTI4 TaxID=3048640 RepID=UPI002AB393B1|nr:GGDEF domain-containing protein [Herbaspirillum sp. RTI4]MDY7578215.1 GGDEF domain-containing protein [Herbaspirillum sp. RTI4]MEA9981553.1 GGDEF domain-containing protein [Herbaspirillum sp. RTI4]
MEQQMKPKVAVLTNTVDLFHVETAALARACDTLTSEETPADGYRSALIELTGHYQRLMRESRRLIARSDRTELELNILNSKLQQLSAELDYKAKHDNLTGALNRGAIFERANEILTTSSLSLIVLDIDFFKRINDEFGHPAGDAVIRELVNRLNHSLQGRGDVGRVGGEEFTVLLPAIDLADAMDIAEAVRRAIADAPFLCLPSHQVTASFGVSWSTPGIDFEDAYGHADTALYQAKHGGRNRVESAGKTTRILALNA